MHRTAIMRTIVSCLGVVAASLIAYACGGTPADEAGTADEALSSDPRPFAVDDDGLGRARKTFATPDGLTEVCVVPKHFEEEGFSGKDTKKEDKLCAIDWNAALGAEGVTSAALLPKDNSTNPATDVLEVTAETSRASIESRGAALPRSLRER